MRHAAVHTGTRTFSTALLRVLPLWRHPGARNHEVMQPTPHKSGTDVDFSLVAMAVVMTIATVFLISQLV